MQSFALKIPSNLQKKLLEHISEFIKITGYKVINWLFK